MFTICYHFPSVFPCEESVGNTGNTGKLANYLCLSQLSGPAHEPEPRRSQYHDQDHG